MTMNRLPFAALLASSALAAMVACGGISDPSKRGNIATVSGALTGSNVPNNARVALVWRKGKAGGVEVGADVPVVNGQFTMNLAAPANGYFFPADSDDYDDIAPPLATPRAPDSPTATEPAEPGGSAPKSTTLTPQDQVSGQIAAALDAAVAGFVVYADTNGNSKLDLEGQYASSPDTILGGNDELMLTYFRGGGTLDYEKMRDKSGIAPVAGYNLAWKEGRWLPLNLVELKLSDKEKLPGAVCSGGWDGGSSGAGNAPSGGSGGVATTEDKPNTTTPTTGRYPAPNDPRLHCAPDGRSFTYDPSPSDCPPPPPRPVGLCANDYGDIALACAGMSGMGLAPGAPIPEGWPCPVPGSDAGPGVPWTDGGVPSDAGTD